MILLSGLELFPHPEIILIAQRQILKALVRNDNLLDGPQKTPTWAWRRIMSMDEHRKTIFAAFGKGIEYPDGSVTTPPIMHEQRDRRRGLTIDAVKLRTKISLTIVRAHQDGDIRLCHGGHLLIGNDSSQEAGVHDDRLPAARIV